MLTAAIQDLEWHICNKLFAVGQADGTVKLVQLGHNFYSVVLYQYKSGITGLSWDPRGKLLATASSDGNCHIWHEFQDTWEILYTLKQPTEPKCLIWSPVIGKSNYPLLLAIGTIVGSICIWILPTDNNSKRLPKLMFNVQGHSYNPVTTMVIHPKGLFLATGNEKGNCLLQQILNPPMTRTKN